MKTNTPLINGNGINGRYYTTHLNTNVMLWRRASPLKPASSRYAASDHHFHNNDLLDSNRLCLIGSIRFKQMHASPFFSGAHPQESRAGGGENERGGRGEPAAGTTSAEHPASFPYLPHPLPPSPSLPCTLNPPTLSREPHPPLPTHNTNPPPLTHFILSHPS